MIASLQVSKRRRLIFEVRHRPLMQEPGTIPNDDILDVLNAKPAYIGPLKAGFQPNDGAPILMVQAELYGRR